MDKSGIALFGHAAVACNVGSQPLSITSEQLLLGWYGEKLPSDTVIEVQISGGNVSETNDAGEEHGLKVPADMKPLSLSETPLPVTAMPLSLLLRKLQDEASIHGRLKPNGAHVDGAPFTVARYAMKFRGNSFSADWGGWSEDGELIYDQRT